MPISNAQPISVGDTVNGSIDSNRVFYSLFLTEAQTVRIFMDGQGTVDAFLRLFDSNQRLIQSNDDGGGNRDSLITRYLPAGQYYVAAGGFADRFVGNYALSISTPPPAVNNLSNTLGTNSGLTTSIQTGDLTRDNTVLLSGTRAAGTTVAIYEGDVLLSSSAWQPQGQSWSFATPALADGLHTLTARFTASDNTVTSQQITVNVDTVSNASLSPVMLTNEGAAASINSGGSTTDRTLGLTGTAEVGSTVQIFDGNRPLGDAVLTSEGNWSFTTPALSLGNHNLSARITDPAGNTFRSGVLSAQVLEANNQTIQVGDTVNSALARGQRVRYSLELSTSQEIDILMDGQGLRDAFLRVYDANNNRIASNDDGGGNLDAKIVRTFAAGTYFIEAAGYGDRFSGTYALSVTSPNAPVANTLSSVLGTNTGLTPTIVSGGQTRDSSIALTGTFATGATVAVYDGQNLLGTSTDTGAAAAAWQLSGNTWTFTTPTLVGEGLHTLRTVFSAPNVASIERTVSVTLDTVINATLSPTILTNSGATASIANGGSTSDSTLGLSGTADAGSLVQIFDGTTLLGNAVLTGTNWSFTTPALSNGAHTLNVKASDAVGNSVTSSATVTLDLPDTVAPYFIPAGNVSVNFAENRTGTVYQTWARDLVSTVRYDLIGGADLTKFSLSDTGALSFLAAPDFEAAASAANNNTYVVQIRARDASDNVALQTVIVNVTDIDEVLPVFSLGSSTSVSYAENSTTTVYTPVASDNVAITRFELVGGADQSKFNINASTGVLSFKASPNFEANGSAAQNNAYVVQIRARDAANNGALQTVTVNVTDVEESGFAFANSTGSATVLENRATNSAAYQAQVSTSSADPISYILNGPDQDLFTVNASGQVFFVNRPDFENPLDAGRDNVYNFNLVAQAGNQSATQAVSVSVSNLATPTSAQAFDLWKAAEEAVAGDSTKSVQALNQYSREIVQERSPTSRDGSANQTDAAKRLSQWVDQVTGTDIVSDAEFDVGFVITGKAAAGALSTIKFRLDNDRTTGVDGAGAVVLNVGSNTVGGSTVTVDYNNTTGEWSMNFGPGSAALKQASHNVHGSGVHQLVVDTDGSGGINGAEASRLFLVASGTASNTDTGLVGQNYSVHDKLTNDVFVYYYGDPDGVGMGINTLLDPGTPGDPGDTAANTSIKTTNRDLVGTSDLDYFAVQTGTFNALPVATAATASNTAMRFVTDISARIWEFHANQPELLGKQGPVSAEMADHTVTGSNMSRLVSLEEALAVYAANFSANSGATVGAVQPMSNPNNGTAVANKPLDWAVNIWTAAPTPSGYAYVNFDSGLIFDWSSAQTGNFGGAAVL